MNIPVWSVGHYEVLRMTEDTQPDRVFFLVHVPFGRHEMRQWGVNLTRTEGTSWFDRLYVLTTRIFTIQTPILDSPYSIIWAPSIDEAFMSACRYAEKLAGISKETSDLIDAHSKEIKYRLQARIEVEEGLLETFHSVSK